MLQIEYVVKDAGGVINLKSFLERLPMTGYLEDRGVFILQDKQRMNCGKVTVKNGQMVDRARREIRKALGYQPELEIVAPSKTTEQEKPVNAPAQAKQKFEVLISTWEVNGKSYVRFFVPKIFHGRRFSVIFDDNKFLLSEDPRGNIFSSNGTNARACVSFSSNEWFNGQRFKLFNSMKLVGEMDAGGIEIKCHETILMPNEPAQLKLPEPSPLPPPLPVQEKAAELENPRDKAKRYISWLNTFANNNNFQLKVEHNLLILERNERISM